ncbi:MAG: type II toxin-antitoxin system HicB family antitoxin [Dehalococcoidia bacterium]
MSKHTAVIEKADGNYSAYCPDLPGCVATGLSIEEATERIKEVIEFHIEGLKAEGLDVPPPATTAALVEVAL